MFSGRVQPISKHNNGHVRSLPATTTCWFKGTDVGWGNFVYSEVFVVNRSIAGKGEEKVRQ